MMRVTDEERALILVLRKTTSPVLDSVLNTLCCLAAKFEMEGNEVLESDSRSLIVTLKPFTNWTNDDIGKALARELMYLEKNGDFEDG